MKTKDIDFKVGNTHPFFVASHIYKNSEWKIDHVHYYKHKYMQKFRFWFENKVLYKISNWFVRKK